jgi:hypothetical protein
MPETSGSNLGLSNLGTRACECPCRAGHRKTWQRSEKQFKTASGLSGPHCSVVVDVVDRVLDQEVDFTGTASSR